MLKPWSVCVYTCTCICVLYIISCITLWCPNLAVMWLWRKGLMEWPYMYVYIDLFSVCEVVHVYNNHKLIRMLRSRCYHSYHHAYFKFICYQWKMILVSSLFQQVDNIEQTLLQWTEKVCILHQNYSWLLFFSVPKLFHLHSLLDNINLDLDAIVREISFLFENSVTICEQLKPDIQVCLLFQIKIINQDISSLIECNQRD